MSIWLFSTCYFSIYDKLIILLSFTLIPTNGPREVRKRKEIQQTIAFQTQNIAFILFYFILRLQHCSNSVLSTPCHEDIKGLVFSLHLYIYNGSYFYRVLEPQSWPLEFIHGSIPRWSWRKQKPFHPRKGPLCHCEGNMVFQMEVPQIILPKEGMPMLSLEHGFLGTLLEDIFIRVNQHDLHKTQEFS